MNFQEFKNHFPLKISKSLVNYVTNTVLRSSRYLFYKTVVGEQFAYCTHCRNQHRSKVKLKHKQKDRVTCPHCNSKCEVRSAGMSRKYMEDRAVLVWYERSRENPQAVTARILNVRRDYSNDYKSVDTEYNCSHMYLFEPGNSHYYQLAYYTRWEKRASIFSAFDNFFSSGYAGKKFMSQANIRQAVKGTHFQYSTWEQYTRYANHRYVSDMVEFFDLAAKYPCIEYLTKSGFEKIVWAKLYKNPTYGAIHWRGKTLPKVLRLSAVEIREVRKMGLPLKPKHLHFYQKRKRIGKPVSIMDAFILADIDDRYYSDDHCKAILKYTSEDKMLKYILKQVRNGHYTEATNVLNDWRDHIRDCKKLSMDLREEKHLFPNNLREAHRKTMRKVKLKEDRIVNNKIKARLPDLQKFCFENKHYILRPAANSIELFDEGKALIHCVGSYADNHANGTTNIFFIREKSNPDKPFYTLQVSGKRVVQCRGYDNCDMTPEVRSFVDQFISRKLLTKKRTRIDITGIRPERQEAIV